MAEIFETELCLTCNVWHVLGQTCGCADTKQKEDVGVKLHGELQAPTLHAGH